MYRSSVRLDDIIYIIMHIYFITYKQCKTKQNKQIFNPLFVVIFTELFVMYTYYTHIMKQNYIYQYNKNMHTIMFVARKNWWFDSLCWCIIRIQMIRNSSFWCKFFKQCDVISSFAKQFDNWRKPFGTPNWTKNRPVKQNRSNIVIKDTFEKAMGLI